ncbi:hypothetical protein D3C73_558190 [compost metagenome]
MNAELVLDRVAENVVALAERSILVDQEFRHQKQRDAARSGRCVRQTGEDQMDDVVGGVMFAPGDENLLAEDAIGAVVARLRAGLQHPEIGAGMRFRQVHGAGPLAGHHLFQKDLLEFIRAVGCERLDRAHRQCRGQREGH